MSVFTSDAPRTPSPATQCTSISLQEFRQFCPESSDGNTQLVNKLLREKHCSSHCEPPSTFEWHTFSDTRYAAAVRGLRGCTFIIVISRTGVFTSHLWEFDPHTDADLWLTNYHTTLARLRSELEPRRQQLSNGEAFIMLPTKQTNSKRDLYHPAVVSAIRSTVSEASGLGPKVINYVPLRKGSPRFEKDERGTACVRFEPRYMSHGKARPVKAVWVYMESKSPIFKTTFE